MPRGRKKRNKAQEEGRARLRQAVRAQMAAWGCNVTDLARSAGLDPGTVADFLAGTRWPNIKSQGHLEQALSWPPGTFHDIATNQTDPPPAEPRRPEEDPELGEIAQDELWIWERTEIAMNRRRALILTYRAIKTLDKTNGNGNGNGSDGTEPKAS